MDKAQSGMVVTLIEHENTETDPTVYAGRISIERAVRMAAEWYASALQQEDIDTVARELDVDVQNGENFIQTTHPHFEDDDWYINFTVTELMQ